MMTGSKVKRNLQRLQFVTVQGSPITDEQIGFMDAFQELFDMRPSQLQLALSKGQEWGVALLLVVNKYAKAKAYVK